MYITKLSFSVYVTFSYTLPVTQFLSHSPRTPQPDMYITELLHSVAFKDNTLGLPLICPDDNVC